jgi:hypothetical protein
VSSITPALFPGGPISEGNELPVWYAPAFFYNSATDNVLSDVVSGNASFQEMMDGVATFKMYEVTATYDDDILTPFFAYLNDKGIALAVEALALVATEGQPGYGQPGFSEGVDDLLNLLTRIKNNGGKVVRVACDEPYYHGYTTGYLTLAATAAQVAHFTTVVKSVFPAADVIDIEPVGIGGDLSPANLQTWWNDYAAAAGAQFSGFQLDIQYNDAGWQADVAAVAANARAAGMDVGGIIVGLYNATTDLQYNRQALELADDLLGTPDLRPDYLLVQSYSSAFPATASDPTAGTTLAYVAKRAQQLVGPNPSSWFTVALGGGGYITGVSLAADGTIYARCDVNNAYKSSTTPGTPWTPLVTLDSMPPPTSQQPYYNVGVDEIVTVPADSAAVYMRYIAVNGSTNFGWFASANGGETWTLTALTGGDWEANNQQTRTWGPKGAIDPANAAAALLGDVGIGFMRRTTNFGAAAIDIPTSSIPAPTSGYGFYGIAYDPSSGTTGGLTNRAIVPSYGNGAYITTNAGSTWAHSAGSPADIVVGACGIDGTYYAIDGSFNLWNLIGTTWTEILSASVAGGLANIACDPHSAGHVVCTNGAGVPQETHNGNTASPTWTTNSDGSTLVISSPTVPWQENWGNVYMSAGGMAFDWTGTVELVIGTGTGPFSCSTVNVPAQTWDYIGLGVENCVARDIGWAPGKSPILVVEDKSFFLGASASAYPTAYGPNAAAIQLGSSVDYAGGNTSFNLGLTSASANGASELYVNSASGAPGSWTPVSAQPTTEGPGGMAVAITDTQFVFVDVNANVVMQSQTGGSVWTAATGLPTGQWGASGYETRHILVADKVTIGNAYVYGYDGVWATTTYGVSWTQVLGSPLAPTFDGYSACMRQAYDVAGTLFWTPGPQGSATSTHPVTGAGGEFQYSTNGGATWANVSNAAYTINEVVAFATGKPATGETFPSIFIVGWVNGIYGAYQCDTFSTPSTAVWYWIGDGFPGGRVDQINIAGGSPNNSGQWLVGKVGSSFSGYGPGSVS